MIHFPILLSFSLVCKLSQNSYVFEFPNIKYVSDLSKNLGMPFTKNLHCKKKKNALLNFKSDKDYINTFKYYIIWTAIFI